LLAFRVGVRLICGSKSTVAAHALPPPLLPPLITPPHPSITLLLILAVALQSSSVFRPITCCVACALMHCTRIAGQYWERSGVDLYSCIQFWSFFSLKLRGSTYKQIALYAGLYDMSEFSIVNCT